MKPYAEIFGEFTENLKFKDLSKGVVEDIKTRFMDLLGIALASSKLKFSEIVANSIVGMGGKPEHTVIGFGYKLPAPNAALINGTLAHSLDFDDTHGPSMTHASSVVVTTAIAIGERENVDGRHLITAAAAGYEIITRIGAAAYNPEFKNTAFHHKGLHGTSICGPFASVAVAGKIMELSADKIADGMGIAGSMSSGLTECLKKGEPVKRMHPGWASHGGIMAAEFARRGFAGPHTIFEGGFGLYSALADGKYYKEKVVEGLGKNWEVLNITYKPYPCCHYTHAPVDAVLYLKEKYDIEPSEIEKIEVGLSPEQIPVCAEPVENKITPKTTYGAQFSVQYIVASALLGGGGLGVYIDDFTEEKIRDPQRLALAKKVKHFVDEECAREFPHRFPSIVRIWMKNGKVYEHRVVTSRGHPKLNPLTKKDLEYKFRLNASRVLNEEKVDELLSKIKNLDKLSETRQLIELLY